MIVEVDEASVSGERESASNPGDIVAIQTVSAVLNGAPASEVNFTLIYKPTRIGIMFRLLIVRSTSQNAHPLLSV